MKNTLETILAAVCGMAVITFGLLTIVGISPARSEVTTLCMGYGLLCIGASIFYASGIFKAKLKKRKS